MVARKGENSIVKVTDARTGRLKRYTDDKGRALAVVINGRLQITTKGVDRGLIVSKGRLVNMGSGLPAW